MAVVRAVQIVCRRGAGFLNAFEHINIYTNSRHLPEYSHEYSQRHHHGTVSVGSLDVSNIDLCYESQDIIKESSRLGRYIRILFLPLD